MKWFNVFLLSAVVNATTTITAAPISITDDSGKILALSKPAVRIISLAPHITEVMFAAGAGDHLIGTVSYSDYPEQAKSIPLVGSYNQVNFETILSMNPDLIIAWYEGNSTETLEKLKTLQIPVYMSNPKTLESIASNIRQFGVIANTHAIAEKAAINFEEKRDRLKKENAHKPPITLFYQVWEDPLYTLGGGHFSKELYRLCGGINIFEDLEDPSPIVNLEAVITRNPQVMLTGGHHGKRSIEQWKQKWQKWASVDAVKNEMMFLIDQDIYTRSSPRVVDAAEDLCHRLDKAREIYIKSP